MKVVVVGGGQVGGEVAQLLIENDCRVTIVEPREDALAKLRQRFGSEMLITGSGTTSAVLDRAGAASADVLCAVTGADETNLTISTMAKFEFGVGRVLARVNNTKNRWLFEKDMGVDLAVNQAEVMAHLVVGEIDHAPWTLPFPLDNDDFAISQVRIQTDSRAHGRTVGELDLPEQATIVAVVRQGEVSIARPGTVLQAGDTAIVFARQDAAEQLKGLLGGMT